MARYSAIFSRFKSKNKGVRARKIKAKMYMYFLSELKAKRNIHVLKKEAIKATMPVKPICRHVSRVNSKGKVQIKMFLGTEISKILDSHLETGKNAKKGTATKAKASNKLSIFIRLNMTFLL
jgi:hypothetical protein